MITHTCTLLLLAAVCAPLVAADGETELAAVRQARLEHNRAAVAVIEHHDPVPPAVVAALQADRLRELRAFRGDDIEPGATGPAKQATVEQPEPATVKALEQEQRRKRELERTLERRTTEVDSLKVRRDELIKEGRRLQRAVERLSRRVRSLEQLSEQQQRTITALQAE